MKLQTPNNRNPYNTTVTDLEEFDNKTQCLTQRASELFTGINVKLPSIIVFADQRSFFTPNGIQFKLTIICVPTFIYILLTPYFR